MVQEKKISAQEMYEIMAAYESGSTIQRMNKLGSNNQWVDCPQPEWNWQYCNYRIKPALVYGVYPYQTMEEFLQEQSEHGPNIILSDKLAAMPQTAQELDGELLVHFSIPAYATVRAHDLMEFMWQDGKRCFNMTKANVYEERNSNTRDSSQMD